VARTLGRSGPKRLDHLGRHLDASRRPPTRQDLRSKPHRYLLASGSAGCFILSSTAGDGTGGPVTTRCIQSGIAVHGSASQFVTQADDAGRKRRARDQPPCIGRRTSIKQTFAVAEHNRVDPQVEPIDELLAKQHVHEVTAPRDMDLMVLVLQPGDVFGHTANDRGRRPVGSLHRS
jgi:hypothetical protein